MISTITLDTYKQQIGSGDAFNVQESIKSAYDMSTAFNGRVGDEQVPLVVQFKERGIAQQFQDGLVPFLTGFVGSLDENDQVTAETGEAVSYVGTSDDIVGLGRVKMNLPGTMFPQEGYFYGFLGLQNADGKRVTTFNVWFHVYNGNPDMFVNKAPFRTELQKLLDAAQQLLTSQSDQFRTSLNDWSQQVIALLTRTNGDYVEVQTISTTVKASLQELENKINADGLMTKSEFDATIGTITTRIDNAVKLVSDESFGLHHLDYATVSTTVSPTSMPSASYEYKHLAKQNVGAVLVVMVNVASSTDPSPITMDDSRVQQAIDNATSAGVKVSMIKPHLGANWSDGFDRQHYLPSNIDEFFENWTNILLQYAALCDKNGIPLLCIECEQTLLTVNNYLSYWTKLVGTLKSKYPNLLLTTASNSAFFDDDQTDIFGLVDIIGVNVYPNYTYKIDVGGNLTIQDIQGSYYDNVMNMNYMSRISTLSYRYQKKFFITEIGVMPQDDGLVHLMSDHYADSSRDYHVQALAMRLMFEELFSNKNICGFSWWHTGEPFDYFNDSQTTEAEQTMIDYVKKVK
ncbi:metallophosphoesterase [Lactiplantibacillus plantarum]|nr:metallophosphoesterase [Lactiplantibacillus plantarum]